MIALATFAISLLLAGSPAPAQGSAKEGEFSKLYSKTEKLLRTALTKPDATQWFNDTVVPSMRRLCEVAGPENTADMTKLFPMSREFAKRDLLHWLAYVGKPVSNRDLFEQITARAAKRDEYDRSVDDEFFAVHGLIRIGDKRAEKVLVKHLLDTEAHPPIRRSIYLELAGLETDEALEAIRSVRQQSRTLPPMTMPIYAQSAEHPEGATVKASTTAGDGTTWDLIEWRGLGSGSDLWIAKRSGSTWTDPAFTGESSYVQMTLPTGTKTEEGAKQELKLVSLITRGDWKRLVGDLELRKDSDSDGYTDIAERWLGLDFANPDTDSDGLLDSRDKNPFVAPRPLTETEEIMAAAFEALVFSRNDLSRNVFVTFPEKTQPFELPSWPGLVLPSREEGKWELVSGKGVRLGFKDGKPVHFPRDANNAEVLVQESGGWYEQGQVFRLKKIHGTWYVTGVERAFSFVA